VTISGGGAVLVIALWAPIDRATLVVTLVGYTVTVAASRWRR
jgi:hypothetical protein